jgi:hypothetical protein
VQWLFYYLLSGKASIENQIIAFEYLSQCGEFGLISAAITLEKFPLIDTKELIRRIYPWIHLLQNDEVRTMVDNVVENLGISHGYRGNYHLQGCEISLKKIPRGSVDLEFLFIPDEEISLKEEFKKVNVTVRGGGGIPILPTMPSWKKIHGKLLGEMLQSHAVGRDVSYNGCHFHLIVSITNSKDMSHRSKGGRKVIRGSSIRTCTWICTHTVNIFISRYQTLQ